jgi:hypothetical protein
MLRHSTKATATVFMRSLFLQLDRDVLSSFGRTKNSALCQGSLKYTLSEKYLASSGG